ncbi:hypothetical protein PAPYR_9687 [Paratrimastix pyriformis]|uniref:Uncharacterized protein n=1 Tax=Paratrimastix pyriformis TaxID=342808 RepID=A0ABQ8U7T9_9EUKA|nr:hypothetical protein PAPYR_9687 [Paratrimastix pyriformis]
MRWSRWELSRLASKAPIPANLLAPAPRWGHSATLLEQNRMVVLGGIGADNQTFADLWVLYAGDTALLSNITRISAAKDEELPVIAAEEEPTTSSMPPAAGSGTPSATQAAAVHPEHELLKGTVERLGEMVRQSSEEVTTLGEAVRKAEEGAAKQQEALQASVELLRTRVTVEKELRVRTEAAAKQRWEKQEQDDKAAADRVAQIEAGLREAGAARKDLEAALTERAAESARQLREQIEATQKALADRVDEQRVATEKTFAERAEESGSCRDRRGERFERIEAQVTRQGADLHADLQTLRAAQEKAAADLEPRLTQLSTGLTAAMESPRGPGSCVNGATQTRLTEAEQGLRQSLEAAEKRAEDARAQHKQETGEQVGALGTRLDQLRADHETVGRTAGEHTAKLTQLEAQAETAAKDLEALRTGGQTQAGQLAQLESLVQTLVTRADAADAKGTAAAQKMDELEKALADQRTEGADTKSKLAATQVCPSCLSHLPRSADLPAPSPVCLPLPPAACPLSPDLPAPYPSICLPSPNLPARACPSLHLPACPSPVSHALFPPSPPRGACPGHGPAQDQVSTLTGRLAEAEQRLQQQSTASEDYERRLRLIQNRAEELDKMQEIQKSAIDRAVLDGQHLEQLVTDTIAAMKKTEQYWKEDMERIRGTLAEHAARLTADDTARKQEVLGIVNHRLEGVETDLKSLTDQTMHACEGILKTQQDEITSMTEQSKRRVDTALSEAESRVRAIEDLVRVHADKLNEETAKYRGAHIEAMHAIEARLNWTQEEVRTFERTVREEINLVSRARSEETVKAKASMEAKLEALDYRVTTDMRQLLEAIRLDAESRMRSEEKAKMEMYEERIMQTLAQAQTLQTHISKLRDAPGVSSPLLSSPTTLNRLPAGPATSGLTELPEVPAEPSSPLAHPQHNPIPPAAFAEAGPAPAQVTDWMDIAGGESVTSLDSGVGELCFCVTDWTDMAGRLRPTLGVASPPLASGVSTGGGGGTAWKPDAAGGASPGAAESGSVPHGEREMAMASHREDHPRRDQGGPARHHSPRVTGEGGRRLRPFCGVGVGVGFWASNFFLFRMRLIKHERARDRSSSSVPSERTKRPTSTFADLRARCEMALANQSKPEWSREELAIIAGSLPITNPQGWNAADAVKRIKLIQDGSYEVFTDHDVTPLGIFINYTMDAYLRNFVPVSGYHAPDQDELNRIMEVIRRVPPSHTKWKEKHIQMLVSVFRGVSGLPGNGLTCAFMEEWVAFLNERPDIELTI